MKVDIALATSASDVKVESSFAELNALGFVRGVTEMDQWFLLVNEGWGKTQLPLNEVVRDYLVTMLHRYSRRNTLFEELFAFNHMAHVFGAAELEQGAAQEIADACLQCAAFFPEVSRYRHAMKSLEYIIEIGQSLYAELARDAEGKDDWFSGAFRAMAESFGQAMLILRSTCPQVVHSPTEHGRAHVLLTDARAHEIRRTMDQLGLLLFKNRSPFGETVLQ